MAVTTHITIPFPAITSGSFDVSIKDDAMGTVVYSGTQTNTPFDVSLGAGCYTMLTTYNDYSNQWCFCVTDCECIPYVSSVISEPSTAGVRYLEITFDVDGWSFCPFVITAVSDLGSNNYNINSISDLTLISGTLYKFIIFVGNSSNVNFKVYKGAIGFSCVTEYLSYACHPAHIADPLHPTSIFIELVEITGQLYIRLRFWDCGTSCHYFTINYDEHYYGPMGPDVGSAIVMLDCSNPSPWQTDVLLNPLPSFYVGHSSGLPGYEYHIVIKDCCGSTVFASIVQSTT